MPTPTVAPARESRWSARRRLHMATHRAGHYHHRTGAAWVIDPPARVIRGGAMTSMKSDQLGRRVWSLFTPYRSSLVLIAVAVLLSSGLGIITPFLTQAAFDEALFSTDGSGVQLELLGWLVGGMVAVPVVSALIGVYQTCRTTLLGNRVMADLRGRLFEHLQRMDLAFFTATRTGVIQSRLANDVGGVQSVLSETASSILGNVVTVVAALVAMVV